MYGSLFMYSMAHLPVLADRTAARRMIGSWHNNTVVCLSVCLSVCLCIVVLSVGV